MKYPTITKYIQNRIDELECEISFVNMIIAAVKKDRKDAEIYAVKLANYESTMSAYEIELKEFKDALICLSFTGHNLVTDEPIIIYSVNEQPERHRQFVGGNDIDFGGTYD